MTAPDPARGRFVVIQLTRLLGVMLVLFGVLLQGGRIESLHEVPKWVGYLLMVVGLVDVFVMPMVLARRWRSPKE